MRAELNNESNVLFYCYTNKSVHTHASVFVLCIQVKMTMIKVTSPIPYMIVYLLTMPLIGSEPENTCYYDVSENSLAGPFPGSWIRIDRVRSSEF